MGFWMKRFKGSSAGSSRGGESHRPHQNNGGGGGTSGAGTSQKPTTQDALDYLKEVRRMFEGQTDKYDMFLEVMKDYKAQRVDTDGIIARVKELFHGHNNLIYGFNAFLPKGHEITITEDEEAPPGMKPAVGFGEAMTFIGKIKQRFHNDAQVYKSFIDILSMYKKEHKLVKDVHHEVASLLSDHPDLLDEFARFLPENPAGRLHSSYRYHEQSSVMATTRRTPLDNPRRRDETFTSEMDRDMAADRTNVDNKAMVKFQRDKRKLESREQRNRDQYYREPEHESNSNANMQRVNGKMKSGRKHEDMEPLSPNDTDAVRRNFKQEFIFCEKVKERMRSAEDYQAFVKVLHMYSNDNLTREELLSLVNDLLGKYPDLIEGFNEFLEHSENDGFLARVVRKKCSLMGGPVPSSSMVEEKDDEQRRINEKYMGKSIHELDLSNAPSCTPSYRLLPDDYPIPSASRRSELDAQVLNDHWVSVTSGSEDYSFKHMRRNQYEESLFRCEDDRFELDMLLKSVSAAVKRIEELLNCVNDNTISLDNSFCLEDHLTALHLRCIERLYGDHGLEVLDILHRNPSVALPIILTRLKEKEVEWNKCLSDFNKIWVDVYAKNHHKSLDHRSFYFKQQDSKNLSAKALVADIKELKGKMQKEDDVVRAISAGNRHCISPHLVFEYLDNEIHEDLYKLIKFSCEEICTTKEQFNKGIWLWTTFLEPMLGVTSRPSEGSEEADKAKSYPGKAIKASIGESNGNMLVVDADISNVNESLSTEKAKSGSFSLANGGTSAKDNIFHPEKEHKGAVMVDTVSGVDEQLTNASASLALLAENIGQDVGHVTSDGPTLTTVDDMKEVRSNIDDAPSLEDGSSKPVSLTNEVFQESTNVSRYHKESAEPSKIEKEEGELSPNVVSEDNLAVCGEGGSLAVHKRKRSDANLQYQAGNNNENCIRDGENDVDPDDEDTGNNSEGKSVSGSESAADEGSHEEHEDDGEQEEMDCKIESEGEGEGEADGIPDANFAENGIFPFISEIFIQTAKPLAKHASPKFPDIVKKEDFRVFYGNDAFYVLFKLHQVLYNRLLSAKVNSTAAEMKFGTEDTNTPDLYGRFLSALYSVLDGSSEKAKYEDECRASFGNQSYLLFTLDKLIYKLVKQLQTISGDETDDKLLQLFEYEKSRKQGNYVDSVYYENVHVLLHNENIYRIECSTAPFRLSVQLMDDGIEKADVIAVTVDPNFSAYIDNEFLSVVSSKKEPPGIFLKRNKRKYPGIDESSSICNALDDVCLVNDMESKMACSSSKISYVLDTEDLLFRAKRRKISSYHDQARIERFRRFVAASR